ncbi:sulfite exporter TauE/SafE family protein [Bacillus massiliigorillae]|uniref:sulfite exporter TauE/SafE family protein n=1 Tax=Bacillus massiliigorillae TaxID=1243664 RepID=UPI0003A7869D|nr:TSUP family transporter [Bacillus massiliigorillae]
MEFSIILIVIGIFSSFIGTLAGGGGLITLPAMMLVGIPIQTGIATNKFSSGIAALTSVSYLLRNKQISFKTICLNLCIASIGGFSGAIITTSISEKEMNFIALLLLVFAFFVTLNNKRWTNNNENSKNVKKQSILFPYLVAMYDGGFGPGSSTFGILYYLGRNETYLKAAQLTRVLILGSCFGAFLVFYIIGFIQWNYAIAMAIGSAIGSQIGLFALPHIPIKVAKNLLTFIIILLIGQVIFKLV